jgi:hypothetical protein
MEEDTPLQVDVSKAERQDHQHAHCGRADPASQGSLLAANMRENQTPDHLLRNVTAPSPVEPPSTTGLCGRCATVPWSRLLEVHDRGPVLVLQDVHESKEELQKSACKCITRYHTASG